MLIILGGLPGVGKTTIAQEVVRQLKAVYLRIDTVEQTLKNTGVLLNGPEGYVVSYAVARDNLSLGLTVVADSVNPIAITRRDWREVAETNHVPFIEIEIFCSNVAEHKRRVETRSANIIGHQLPTWDEITVRDYDPWETVSLRVDTAVYSSEEGVAHILKYIQNM